MDNPLILGVGNSSICTCGHTKEVHQSIYHSMPSNRYCMVGVCDCENFTKPPKPKVTWNHLYDALKRAGFQQTAELIASWQDEWLSGDADEALP